MKTVQSVLIVMLLLIGVWTLAFNIQPVKATGTIYIRANGSVDSPAAPISTTDNVTYTLMGNINDMIVVQKDNIVIDGRSYSVQRTNASDFAGMDLTGRHNVTIKNMNITALDYGICLNSSS